MRSKCDYFRRNWRYKDTFNIWCIRCMSQIELNRWKRIKWILKYQKWQKNEIFYETLYLEATTKDFEIDPKCVLSDWVGFVRNWQNCDSRCHFEFETKKANELTCDFLRQLWEVIAHSNVGALQRIFENIFDGSIRDGTSSVLDRISFKLRF